MSDASEVTGFQRWSKKSSMSGRSLKPEPARSVSYASEVRNESFPPAEGILFATG